MSNNTYSDTQKPGKKTGLVSPVIKFTDTQEIAKCAEYYVELLGLQDWRIVYNHTDDINPDFAGQCDVIFEEKCAKISIRKTIPDDLWFKEPQELVLIHELIHCKLPMIDTGHMEGTLVHQYYHTLIDDWARSIFHAKYNIDNTWYFK